MGSPQRWGGVAGGITLLMDGIIITCVDIQHMVAVERYSTGS